MSTAWHNKLLGGFKRTSDRLIGNLAGLGAARLDDATLDEIEEALCDNCKGRIGYNLLETDDGRLEHAYWHYTALILHGPQFPVVRLCEDCAAPVIQPPAPTFPNPLRRSAIWEPNRLWSQK